MWWAWAARAWSPTPSGARQSETTWNDSAGGGGGGISAVWTIPTWQQGLANSSNKASSTMRNVPDVVAQCGHRHRLRDLLPGRLVRLGWHELRGSSLGRVQCAGQSPARRQWPGAPGLRQSGALPDRPGKPRQGGLLDIADGSTNGYYPAVAGYDDATGWGPFTATNLLQDLSQNPAAGSSTAGSTPNSCGSSG